MSRKPLASLVAVLLFVLVPASVADAEFGLESVGGSLRSTAGEPLLAAGAHPDLTTEISFNTKIDSETGKERPDGNARNVEVALPAGLIGNPTATPKCTQSDLLGSGGSAECDPEAQVGLATITNYISGPSNTTVPVYNLEAPPGVAGQFGFNFLNVLVFANSGVTNNGQYSLTSRIANISQGLAIGDTKLTLWGVPAAPAHDTERTEKGGFGFPDEPVPSTAPPKPLISNPSACPGTPLSFGVRADSWQAPGVFAEAAFSTDTTGNPIVIEDCQNVPFEASLTAQPTTGEANSPTGLDLAIEIPQNEFPAGRSTALLRDAVVTLPAGMTINAASAGGLGSCDEDQAGLDGEAAASCPPSSKIGTVRIDTPLLDDPLVGGAYLARQAQNKFGSLLALYFAVDDPQSGTVLKLAGRVDPDPATGRLAVTFPDNPQLPFERLQVKLFGGPRASLKTPDRCGAHTTAGEFAPWSGTAPIGATDSFQIASGPDGGPCPSGEFRPELTAGSTEPLAAEFSPFVLRLSRDDGNRLLRSVEVSLPGGLLARLAGTPYCPDSALEAIPATAGTAAAQLADPSCPAASEVGKVSVLAGAGSSPLPVRTGRAYLAGPYKGAPLSLAIVTPALAGPLDLGNVVVRSALHLDPSSTAVRVVSDPLPTILHGIPLDLRELTVHLDRPRFTLNPTSCREKRIAATVAGSGGATASLEERFQVTGCRALAFSPGLKLKLAGATGRTGHPALTAVLRAPRGQANIRRVVVTLPSSEILSQDHIRTICTRVQFRQDSCPKGSIYGRAAARTPLLDEPLRGPVFLRASDNPLPDLVADLRGQIDVELVGAIDSGKGGGMRTTFRAVPDAPVTKFTLRLQGGRKGLLANRLDLCRKRHVAIVRMRGHNGRIHDLRSPLRPSCD